MKYNESVFTHSFLTIISKQVSWRFYGDFKEKISVTMLSFYYNSMNLLHRCLWDDLWSLLMDWLFSDSFWPYANVDRQNVSQVTQSPELNGFEWVENGDWILGGRRVTWRGLTCQRASYVLKIDLIPIVISSKGTMICPGHVYGALLRVIYSSMGIVTLIRLKKALSLIVIENIGSGWKMRLDRHVAIGRDCVVE